MNKSTKNILKIASIILAVAVILMELNNIPSMVNYHFFKMDAFLIRSLTNVAKEVHLPAIYFVVIRKM